MSSKKPLAAAVTHTEVRRPSVEQRIERRLEVLRHWLREGLPEGKRIPKDLNAARKWDDLELAIVPIASPNEFTTTHPIFGERIRNIASLLTDLRKKFDRPLKFSLKAPVSTAKFDRKATDRQLRAIVSQWHCERDERVKEKKRAASAEARIVLLLEESNQKDELIADLRQQLASKKGVRAVK